MLNKIPGFIPGIFFLSSVVSSGQSLDLASGLFDDQQWTECRRECQRFLLSHPGDEYARLMWATASIREGVEPDNAIAVLTGLVETASSEIKAMAGYEAGHWYWLNGNMTSAWSNLRVAFESTRSPWLYLHSSCALDTLHRRDRKLADNDVSLVTQLKTTRPLWTRTIRYVSNPENNRRKSGGGAGGLLIGFYRNQIRPAIGSRCSLHPSCSEYFLEANHDHGWLSYPMVADRLVREPGVVSRAEKPIAIKNEIRYQDPLADHDFWFDRKN